MYLWRLQFALLLVLAIAGCGGEIPRTPSEQALLYDRPLELDRSLVESFKLQINATDALEDEPTIVEGQPFHITGVISLKPNALDPMRMVMAKLTWRPVVDGEADWESEPDKLEESLLGNVRGNENDPTQFISQDIDKIEDDPLDPGSYEWRVFLVLREHKLNGDTDYLGNYQIAQGKFRVVEADEPQEDAADGFQLTSGGDP